VALFNDQGNRKKKEIKMGKLLLSHRYNSLPLLRSHPGGVREELVVKDLPTANIEKSSKAGYIFINSVVSG